MKSQIKLYVSVFLFVFAGLCIAQTASKTQTAPPKAGSPAPAPAAKEKAGPETDEAIPPADANAIFPAVVARINGKPILGRDLEIMVRRELTTIGNPEWKNLREDYRGQLTLAALNSLISTRLISEKAVASGIKATDAEVQAELQNISKNFKNDAEMNAALANRMMDRALLEKELSESLTVSKYIEETINKKITVTPEEVTKFYTSNPSQFQHPDVVRSSHILISSGDTTEQEVLAKQRAESILARVKKGEDFAKLAKEYSTDGSASQGGDIGFNTKDSLTPQYAEAAFSLAVGGVKLVKSEYGYHIIKVTEKKGAGLYTLEEARPQLTQFLKSEKAQAELAKLINQLRDQAKIEILIPAGQPLNP